MKRCRKYKLETEAFADIKIELTISDVYRNFEKQQILEHFKARLEGYYSEPLKFLKNVRITIGVKQ